MEQLHGLAEMGRIGQHTWVKEKHQTEWKKLSELFAEEEAAAAAPKVPRINRMAASTPASSTPTPITIPAPATPTPVAAKPATPVTPAATQQTSSIPQPSFVRSQPQPTLQFAKNPTPIPTPAIKQLPQEKTKEPIQEFVKEFIKESVKESIKEDSTPLKNLRRIAEQPAQPKIANYDIPRIQEISSTSTISGIINVLVGCLWLGLGSIFSMIPFAFALPPALYCIMTGVFEITYASNLLVKQAGSLKQARTLALLSIFSICCGNVISSILGIKNIVSYNDYRVRLFFETR